MTPLTVTDLHLRLDVLAATVAALARCVPVEQADEVRKDIALAVARANDGLAVSGPADESVSRDLVNLLRGLPCRQQ